MNPIPPDCRVAVSSLPKGPCATATVSPWVRLGVLSLALWMSACAQAPRASADAAPALSSGTTLGAVSAAVNVPATHTATASAATSVGTSERSDAQIASMAEAPATAIPVPDRQLATAPATLTAPSVERSKPAPASNPILLEWAQDASDWARSSPHVSSEGEPVDTTEPRVFTDLLERIRAGYGMTDLDNERVAKWVNWYASRPDYVARMMDRGERYLFHVVEEVQKRQMPTELALLPFVESAFNPQAMSSARASGMWQFMPATGKDFELKQNIFRDDRRDVLASTRAALDYLEMLHRQFKDWHLALAAYNWGQGNVQRAMDRNRRQGLPTDFDSLTMPDETRNYVPKLMAVKRILTEPDNHGLQLPRIDNHPYFLVVDIERDLDVRLVADLAGLEMDEFKALNPQLNKPVIFAAGTPQVLLPYDNANQFIRRLKAHKGPFATWTAWVAPSSLRLGEVAKRVGMNESELREINLIPKGMMVRLGSTLLVTRKNANAKDVSDGIADEARMMLVPEPPEVVRRRFTASAKGETVQQFAKRNRLDAKKVAAWNGLKVDARLHARQVVWIEVPSKTLAKASNKSFPSSSPKTSAQKQSAPVKTAKAPNRSTKACSPKDRCSANPSTKPPVKLAKAP
jgi:membrane-bound lytic murein transglycosylase D